MKSMTSFLIWSIWIFCLFSTAVMQCQDGPLLVHISSLSHSIQSPGYGNSDYLSDMDCSWVITTDPDQVILYSLFINSVECFGDSVTIYYGSERIFVENTGYTCGDNITFGPFSDNPDVNMSVIFKSSDKSNGGAGFYINVIAVPKNTLTICFENPIFLSASEEFSFIASENFPADYKGNSSCEWRIASTQESRNVILEILYMDIETEEDCSLDYLQVKNEQSSSIRRYCETNDFEVKRFKASEFSLEFSSDESVQFKGFIVRYRLDNATKPECSNRTTDIVFMADTTVDATEDGFNHQLMIISDVISNYNVSTSRVRFGTVIYEDTPFNLYWLNEYSNTRDLLNVTSLMPYIDGYGRGTHKALEFVQKESLCSCNGARNSSIKLVVIFMFGDSDEPGKAVEISKSLHSENVHIISIGVGSSVNKTEIGNIASEPANAYFLDRKERLSDFSYILMERICAIIGYESENTAFSQSSTIQTTSVGTASIAQSSEVQMTSSTFIHTISPTAVPKSVFSSESNSFKHSTSTLTIPLEGSLTSIYTSANTSISPLTKQETLGHTKEITTIYSIISSAEVTNTKDKVPITPSLSSTTAQQFSMNSHITTTLSSSSFSSVLKTSSTAQPPHTTTDTSMIRLSDDGKLTMVITAAFVPSALAFLVIVTIITCLIAKACKKLKKTNKCHVKNMEDTSSDQHKPNWISMAENFQISERAQLKIKMAD